MSEKVINHEEYIENLPKTVKIYDRIFEYDKDQVFYKNNVVTWFKYWWWRVLILIVCLCCYVINLSWKMKNEYDSLKNEVFWCILPKKLILIKMK